LQRAETYFAFNSLLKKKDHVTTDRAQNILFNLDSAIDQAKASHPDKP